MTKIDNLYHTDIKTKEFYGFNGSAFNITDAKRLILELDKSLHPSREDGVFYIRQQKAQTPLNNKLWASKPEYITHLKFDSNHSNVKNWDLDKLSRYELKAIHDDSHAGKLGKINHLK